LRELIEKVEVEQIKFGQRKINAKERGAFRKGRKGFPLRTFAITFAPFALKLE
jgi:hypothetical protein